MIHYSEKQTEKTSETNVFTKRIEKENDIMSGPDLKTSKQPKLEVRIDQQKQPENDQVAKELLKPAENVEGLKTPQASDRSGSSGGKKQRKSSPYVKGSPNA